MKDVKQGLQDVGIGILTSAIALAFLHVIWTILAYAIGVERGY